MIPSLASRLWTALLVLASAPLVRADAADPVGSAGAPSPERGRSILLSTALVPAEWPRQSYEELWKRWGLAEKPADFDVEARERYGLHDAPFENGGLPMGIRERKTVIGSGGIAHDCLLCHAGSIAGRGVIGLGNSSLDVQALTDDLFAGIGMDVSFFPAVSVQRGTVEAATSVRFLMRFRDRNLDRRIPRAFNGAPDLIEDIPAWWLLKKKRTMFHTGAVDSRAVRPFMTFLLSPIISGKEIRGAESTFADILAYVRTLQVPEYPFAIDRALAARGEKIFEKTCSKCHGTYGEDGRYPNRFVPLEKIGTDPTLTRATTRDSEEKRHYLSSWLAAERWDDTPVRDWSVPGYQAPPLDGVWATAPYFHNASVPTVWHVLQSSSRPSLWTRSFRTDEKDFDKKRLGWKFTVPAESRDDRGGSGGSGGSDRRKIYDTSLEGRGNTGHEFGDELDDDERFAVIEYLKTL